MTTAVGRFVRFSNCIVVVAALFWSLPAGAGVIFNGTTAQSGAIGGYQIAGDNSYELSSLFYMSASDTIRGVTFETYGGDSVSTIDWAISCCAYGSGFNAVFELGTATTTDIDLGGGVNFDYFAVPALSLPSGGYDLTLWGATGVNNGSVYWDESGGSNSAQAGQAFGEDPSGPTPIGEALTFQILDSSSPSAPEPSTGVGAGLALAAACFYRRRRSGGSSIGWI